MVLVLVVGAAGAPEDGQAAKKAAAARGEHARTARPAPQAIRIVQSSGFHWGDAAIGAAGTIGLIGLGACAFFVVQPDRSRRRP